MDLFIIILLIAIELELLVFGAHYVSSRTKKYSTKPVFIDTSALIDGRIAMIAAAGFMPSRVVIPQSVLAELQLLADGSDSEKRARARHGLDIAKELRDTDGIDVEVLDDGQTKTGVDDRLLELARLHTGSICTIDFNLNKVAQVEGIAVLNINELAQRIRVNYLPGEKLSLLISQKGNDASQGVGYLADGTMVVVEHAKADIGKTVEIEFIRTIQTAAGQMLFAKKIDHAKSKKSNNTPKRRNAESTLVNLANKAN